MIEQIGVLSPRSRPTHSSVVTGLSPQERFGRNVVLFAIASLVLVRLFTEVIHVIPRAANFSDLPLAVVMLALATTRPRLKTNIAPVFLPSLALFTMCVVGVVANPSRVAAGPVVLFVLGMFEPLAFYYATLRLWPPGNSLALSRFLVALGLCQFAAVAAIDLPRFLRSGNPDQISGTFGTNAYQLVFFLLVVTSLVAGIASCEPKRLAARMAPLFFVASFGIIFLAQYRSLLVTTALTAILVATIIRRAHARGLLIGLSAVVAVGASLVFVANQFPTNRLSPALRVVEHKPGSLISQKLEPFRAVLDLYTAQPQAIVTGTGPGTYSSRAWETFALIGIDSKANVAAPYVSRLTGGVAYHTDVSDRYVLPRYKSAVLTFGSQALSTPLVSYTSLLAEVGLFGFAAVMALYLGALLQSGKASLSAFATFEPGDPLPAILLATTVAFFVLLQMAFFDNWFEVTRVTVPAWMLLAVSRRELADRRENKTTLVS